MTPTPYYQDGSVTLFNGDCLAVMPLLAAASVDAIVTDPPYGLKFMGKTWDHGVPGVPFWIEALRLAKPGSYLLAFGGTRTFHRLTCAIEDAGWEIQDCLCWLYGSGFPKHKSKLKPAYEPIVMARKSASKASPLNIDACRIATHETLHGSTVRNDIRGGAYASGHQHYEGRWPANVVLDEIAAAQLDEASGSLTSNSGEPFNRNSDKHRTAYSRFEGRREEDGYYGDTGGASRFFYTSKASRSEREAGLEGVAPRLTGKSGGAAAAAAARGDEYDIGDGGFNKTVRVRNGHPTVKPLDLMTWLVRLITPPNGLVLDPFMGSGTTGKAALAEGFRFIGIEKEAEYMELAAAPMRSRQEVLDFGGAA